MLHLYWCLNLGTCCISILLLILPQRDHLGVCIMLLFGTSVTFELPNNPVCLLYSTEWTQMTKFR